MLGVSPYIFSIGVIVFWKLYGFISKADTTSKIFMSLLITYNYLQPSLILVTSKLVSCTEVDQGKFYLASELTIECYTERHYLYVILILLRIIKFNNSLIFSQIFALMTPTAVVWILIYPVTTLFILFKNKRSLFDNDFNKYYGFLYNGYQRKYYFWY